MADFNAAIATMTEKAKATTVVMAQSTSDQRNQALSRGAELLRQHCAEILVQNEKDVANAHADGQDDAFIDRLKLDAGRVDAMANGLVDIAGLTDPLGVNWRLDSAQWPCYQPCGNAFRCFGGDL